MSKNLRPPAVPLVTIDPYFSVWSMSDHLYDNHTKHWTCQRNSMVGIAMIDGVAWRFMGKVELYEEIEYHEPQTMTQKSLEVQPLSSIYIFEGGGVTLEVDFTSPLLLNDLDLLSRPASYVTFRIYSNDGKQHSVKIYFDVSGEWCVDTFAQKVSWSRKSLGNDIETMYIGSDEQNILGQDGDDMRIDWGYFYLVVPKTLNTKTVIGSYNIRKEFVRAGMLNCIDDIRMPREVKGETPVMACVIDFQTVGAEKISYFLVLAYDDIYSIEYFNKPLRAYWRRKGMTTDEMLLAAVNEYQEIMDKCNEFGKQLVEDATRAGGEKYADILALAYRQAIDAHKLVTDENGEILFFSKECFSNGCMGTVDVSYPSIPIFLIYNPELVKGMLRPIFKYARSVEWTFDFAPHDVGRYPRANGQVYRKNKGNDIVENQMPIEECGNMLIMMAAVCLAEGDAEFAQDNWDILTKWSTYLVDNGFDPGNQLCTDDFAGHLAHNANLSIKAIMGIVSYSILCKMLGKSQEENQYLTIAKELAIEWDKIANDGDHYRLTFDSPGTWSQKYNLVWDSIFGLNIFPSEIKEKEISHYLRMQNRYGVPLDSRKDYTKVDWILWSAALADSREDFEKFVIPVWDFLNETKTRVPFTDWYDTVTGLQSRTLRFQNRSVIGGVFIKLLKEKELK